MAVLVKPIRCHSPSLATLGNETAAEFTGVRQPTGIETDTTSGMRTNAPLVYWIRNPGQEPVPDAIGLHEQGIAMRVLDSVDAWAAREAGNANSTSLLVVDMDTANSEPMRTLFSGSLASMKPTAWIVSSEVATENAMLACLRAGAVDWVPLPYARDYMDEIVKKHFNDQGGLRLDPSNIVVAIDSHSAMTRSNCDHVFFGSLLHLFFEELPARLKCLRNDWESNPVRFRQSIHSLKGLAATLGLQSLCQVSIQAEAMASPAGQARDTQIMVQLEGEIQSARFQIMRWLALNGQSIEVTQ